ncbi:MAG: ribonuclease HII [Clostridia bacterium]|nr:ribonuclease HII [Clostridia bacterium]
MEKKELDRLKKMMEYEEEIYLQGYTNICGIDEAGRGPLCGPVVAAAVILPKDFYIEGVDDSKKLSEKKREKLYEEITKNAISWSVGISEVDVIEEVNILNATRLAMKQAVECLSIKAEYALVDAEKKVPINIPFLPIIKGDSLSQSIAAASIIAKVTRDRMLVEFDKNYPEYGFLSNKGYGTKSHVEAIKKYGLCEIHRPSFCKKFV